MSTIDHGSATIAASLRKLYFARFGFAILWAVVFAITATTLNPLSISLLVLYPVIDLIAAVIDYRASRAIKPTPVLYINMALSLLTAVGLAIAATSGASAALAVWGAWAITAGGVQLIVAITRRRLGGQVPMILSGGISVLAGTAFVLSSGTATSVTGIAGYAVLGGIFFLVSALLLGRTAKGGTR